MTILSTTHPLSALMSYLSTQSAAPAVSPGSPLPPRLELLKPLTLVVPLPAFCVLFTAYKLISPRFPDTRSRAYVLSSISSCCMTLSSIPFVLAYLRGGLPAIWAAGQSGWTSTLATIVVPAFATYLLMDLAVGCFEYPDQIGMLTGWFHHIVYTGLMAHLATSRQSCIFLTGAVMELPTFDLAISHLFPSVRSDERFLTLMLLTRIIFNIVLFIDCARPSSRALTDDSWVPTVMLGAALSLHCTWMHGGVKGYLKRRAKGRAVAAKTNPKSSKKVPAPVAVDKPRLKPIDDGDLDITTPDMGTVTPDESPLVTPYTPSQPSLIIPQHLFPNISMPTMANLPIPNIPTLSGMAAMLPEAKANLNHLHFGLKEAKEAVRERWEEQRERLAAAGLRLRRRDTDLAIDDDME